LCHGQKIFRLSAIASAANERRCIWRGAKDLTFTILLCSVLFISGMITVDQAISLIAGVFAFFFSICVVLNDYNKVKFENILWYSVISTMLFLIVYLLLAPQITLSENLKCFRLINIGNTLTFFGLFFSTGVFYYKKRNNKCKTEAL
ncbi:hypothetical protein KHX12_03145, partial [butyrate-producing bacterium]|nr:hypothetical protein [butyrate-producing bacterium]